MPTYASAELLREYITPTGVPLPADDAKVDALIERAEHDVDRLLGPYAVHEDTGLKLDPTELTTAQAGAIARATCAAAEFRAAQGETELIGTADGISALGGISFDTRPLPRVAPKALEELAGHALILRSGCALAEVTEADATL